MGKMLPCFFVLLFGGVCKSHPVHSYEPYPQVFDREVGDKRGDVNELVKMLGAKHPRIPKKQSYDQADKLDRILDCFGCEVLTENNAYLDTLPLANDADYSFLDDEFLPQDIEDLKREDAKKQRRFNSMMPRSSEEEDEAEYDLLKKLISNISKLQQKR